MTSPLLGQFEQIVLTAVVSLGEDAYGISVHRKAEELSRPRKVSLGAIYATLDRLEDKGLISSRLSEPTPERGGRARRCYRIEKSGLKALGEAVSTAQRLIEAVMGVAGGMRWKTAR